MARTRPESFSSDSAKGAFGGARIAVSAAPEPGPLGGARIAVSAAPEAGALAALLEAAGARVFRFAEVAPSDERAHERWLGALIAGEFDDVVFFSAQGVRLVCEMARQLGRESAVLEALRATRLVAEGSRTTLALAEFGLHAAARSTKPGVAALLSAAMSLGVSGRVVALQPKGSPPDESFARELVRAGATVHGVTDRASPDTAAGELLARILNLGVDTLVLFGLDQVAWLWDAALSTGRAGALREALSSMSVVASESAAEALRDRGVRARAVPARLLRGGNNAEGVHALFQSSRRTALAGRASNSVLVLGSGDVAREFSECLEKMDSGNLHRITRLEDGGVTRLDCDRQLVLNGAGETWTYDVLVLSTGSTRIVPPLLGADKQGVLIYRSREDLLDLGARSSGRSVAVVGTGLDALEAAEATKNAGLVTHLVSSKPRLLAELLDTAGADVLRRRLGDFGVLVHLGRSLTRVNGNEHATGIKFSDGSRLDVDLVVLVADTRPADELARAAGLEVDEHGGIVVDEDLRTSDPRVYAIGECALGRRAHPGSGKAMARVLAARLARVADATSSVPEPTGVHTLFGIEIASVGDPHADAETGRSIVFSDVTRGIYKKLALSSDGAALLGAVLVGDTSDLSELVRAQKGGKLRLAWEDPTSQNDDESRLSRRERSFDVSIDC